MMPDVLLTDYLQRLHHSDEAHDRVLEAVLREGTKGTRADLVAHLKALATGTAEALSLLNTEAFNGEIEDFCVKADGDETQCNAPFQCDSCGHIVDAEMPTWNNTEWVRTCQKCGVTFRVRPFTDEPDVEAASRRLRLQEVSRRCGGLTSIEAKELDG